MRLLVILFCFLFFLNLEAYQPSEKNRDLNEPIPELAGLEVQEHLGETLNLNLTFQDSMGKTKKLGDFFNHDKPVLMTVIYYTCPALCPLHLDGLVDVFKTLPKGWVAGRDFTFLALSMDPKEGVKDSLKKKKALLKKFGKKNIEDWHFLTGTKENIKIITDQLGFQFRWDEESAQYAHPALAYLLTPKAKISSYLYGVRWGVKDLKLALTEAGQGSIGNVIDRLILFCFQFDPRKNKYSLYAYNVMRLAGLFTVIMMFAFFFPVWVQNFRKKGSGS